jgi:DegT/DnrJ/EryC1/StrS aminotransferase family
MLPPAHSPVTLEAVASGIRALAGGAARARGGVTAALSERFGCCDLLLTDSGTSALTLALRAGRQRTPGPVALPAYGCYDIATAADGSDAQVLLYDLDPATLGPNPDSLRETLEHGARTVVVAHLYGIPVELAAVRSLTGPYDALLIEDAAQGAGAGYGGRPLGSLGSLGVLSFGRGKGVTAGRGGALLANDTAGAAALAAVRGRLLPGGTSTTEPIALLAQWALGRPSLYAIPASLPFLGLGETVYRRPREPRGISAFALGVLRRTLSSTDGEAASRRAHAERLLSHMGAAGPDLVAVQTPAPAIPGYLRLPLLVSEAQSKRVRSNAATRLGIMPGYPGTLGELPGFGARVCNRAARFPGARRLVDSLATLPTYGLLRERDLRALEGWIDDGDTHPSR